MLFGDRIAKAVAKQVPNTTAKELEMILETPPDSSFGDVSLPCFMLSRVLKKNPAEIASDLAGKVKPNGFAGVNNAGPYLNFFYDAGAIAKEVLPEVIKQGENYGSSRTGKKKKIMLEYSAPNTNKPLHLGHLRNSAIGMCISNVLEATGNTVVKANLVNDRGIHIAKSMLAYEKWGKEKTPESAGKKGDHFVGNYYVMYNKMLEKDNSLEDEARELLKKWESGDKKTIALWKKMNSWVFKGFKETYKNFGSEFNEWMLESEFYDKAQPLIEKGLRKKVFFKADDGAVMAELEKQGMPNKTVLRADGTSIYLTNDLALTKYKFEKFKLDESIWVVASEQNLYFKQLFKILELLGFKWACDCRHLSYGMVFLPHGKMKSREGTVVDADDLIASVEKLAVKEVRKRHKNLSKKEAEKRASAVALAAIKFFLLRTDAAKDIVFNPEESVSFDGETGPYVQYAYARAKSILRKAGKKTKPEYSLLKHSKEKELVSLIARYPSVVEAVASSGSPHVLSQFLLELAAAFNSFYQAVPVLTAKKGVREARLEIVRSTATVIFNGLRLLGIQALEQV